MTAAHQDIGTNPRRPFLSGDSRIIRVAVTNGETPPVAEPLTSSTIRWQVFISDEAGFEGAAVLQKSVGSGIAITDALGGIFEVSLDPADTAALEGLYYHEAEVVFPGGAVHTVLTGKLRITADAIV